MSRRTLIFTLLLTLALTWVWSPGRAQLRTLKVGIIPIGSMVPFFTALEKGFFEKEGLKIETVPMRGGAVILPAVAGGSLDIGYSADASTIIARSQGFDFKIISHNNDNNTITTPGTRLGYKGHFALLVRADSSITSAKDLKGKRIAVNTLNSIDWAMTSEWLDMKGADPSTVRWVEVAFPKMPPALISGQVDAVAEVEPFITFLVSKGEARVVDHVFSAVKPDLTIASFVATESWIRKNRRAVEGFARAQARGVKYINAHPEEAPVITAKYTRMSAEVARRIVPGRYSSKVDMEGLRWLSDLLRKRGLLKKRMDLRQLVHDTAR